MHRPDRRTFLLGSAGATAAAISLLSSAAGKAERGDKRADSCDPGKAQAGRRTQFGPSSIGSTISDRTEEATAWRNNPVPMRSEEFISAPFPRP